MSNISAVLQELSHKQAFNISRALGAFSVLPFKMLFRSMQNLFIFYCQSEGSRHWSASHDVEKHTVETIPWCLFIVTLLGTDFLTCGSATKKFVNEQWIILWMQRYFLWIVLSWSNTKSQSHLVTSSRGVNFRGNMLVTKLFGFWVSQFGCGPHTSLTSSGHFCFYWVGLLSKIYSGFYHRPIALHFSHSHNKH